MSGIDMLLGRLAPAAIAWDSAGLRITVPEHARVPKAIAEEVRTRRGEIIDHLEGLARERGRLLRAQLQHDHAALTAALTAEHARIAKRLASYRATLRDDAA